MRLGISVLRSTSVKVGTAAALKGPRTATVKLQPGKRVIVQVTEGGRTSSHSIRCVPSDFPRSSATGMLPADIPMLAINDISSRTRSKTSNTSYAIIVDRHGVPIWWHKENLSLVNFFATPDGSLAIGHASGPLKLLSPRGNVTGSVKPVNGDVDGHDASPTGAGRWLMALHTTRSKVDLRPIGLAASGKTIDSSILEVDAHGKTLWSWSSAQHFATSESILTQVTKSTAGSIADLAHVNSFEEDGQGGIIASFRNTSAVYRIIKATGEIDWKLGGSTTPKSLTVLGDPGISAAFHLLGQHDARLQDDGTLTLFDNGSTVVQ